MTVAVLSAIAMVTATLAAPALAALPAEVDVSPPQAERYSSVRVTAHACGRHAIRATGATTAAQGTFTLTKGPDDTDPVGSFTVSGTAPLGPNTVTVMCDTGPDFTVEFTVLKGAAPKPASAPKPMTHLGVEQPHKMPHGAVHTGVGGSVEGRTGEWVMGMALLGVGAGGVCMLRRQVNHTSRRDC